MPDAGWDWDRTIAVAAREDVLPALYPRLQATVEVSDFLEAIHELNRERNRQLLNEIEMHSCLLHAAGIEPVVLKGAAYLVAGVYRDPSDRLLRDIDLLVETAQSAKAFEIIQSSGYEPYIPNPTALVLHHHPTLTRVHRVPVEIHHQIGKGACGVFLTAREIVAASRRVMLGRAVVRVPAPEHLLIHLILHSQVHHAPHARIWPSLRDMHDLVRLSRQYNLDWESIRSRFRAHRKESLLNLHLLQVEKAMHSPAPFEINGGGPKWWYRQALWREPRLRFIDPVYTFSRMALPKIELGYRLLRLPIGRKYILLTPFRPSFYKRFIDEIAQG
jgi:hypothetical protein